MNKRSFLVTIVCISIFLSGCSYGQTTEKTVTEEETEDTGFNVSEVGTYDSADTAVIVGINDTESTITFQKLQTALRYTLFYDGTTHVKDKHEEAMTVSQLQAGNIVSVTFLKNKKRINSIMMDPDAWTNSDVNRFTISKNGQRMTIADEEYKYDENMVIVSNGELAEPMDVNDKDTLVVSGIDHTVYSIVVDQGHGYLRLDNDEYFIGGWIEVGSDQIQVITEDMLLTVPVGTYDVAVSNNGASGTKEVTIVQNEEVSLDVGDLKGEGVKSGDIAFSLNPSEAVVKIDGEEVNTGDLVTLQYGIHQIVITADGYTTIKQYIKVGQSLANLDIEMEKEGSDSTDAKTSDSSSGSTKSTATNPTAGTNSSTTESTKGTNSSTAGTNSSSTGKGSTGSTNTADITSTAVNGYRVYIEAPSGAEVYVDGNYVGIAPIDFKKITGSHEVVLRKDGFQTKSYTIQVDEEEKDISYSFSNLVAKTS